MSTTTKARDVKEPQEVEILERARAGETYQPLVDILEAEHEVTLLADLPGVRPDGIEVRFENGVLSLSGRVEPGRRDERTFLLHEYGVGDFERSFRVSEAIDASEITADYDDGVLKLHLPKTAAVRPRRIEVRKAPESR